MQQITVSLPEEIISAEILPRLPVKSLLRFKWVSKSWFSLISTKKFAKTQLQYSAKNNTLLTDPIAVLISVDTLQGFIISHGLVNSLFTQTSMLVDHFDSSHWMMGYVPHIVGCYNGLCCMLINGKHFQLWNPSTGEIRKLPPVMDGFQWEPAYGFGYDESNDDYKIVAMLKMKTKLSMRGTVFIRLYSLKTNSWKTINDSVGHDTFRVYGAFEGKGTLFNAKLHWMHSNRLNLNIVSFDLRMEAAGVIELPSFTNVRSPYQMGVIEGCLCVICDSEVWLMKEYGVKESWFKWFTVPSLNSTAYGRSYKYIICISEDGIVLKDDDRRSTLLIYHPEMKPVRHLRMKVRDVSKVDFCIQSLYSPFHYG